MVLSRKLDESIVVGDDIVITIVAIRGDQVRIGVSAPIDVEVDRSEIREVKDRERRKRDQQQGEEQQP